MRRVGDRDSAQQIGSEFDALHPRAEVACYLRPDPAAGWTKPRSLGVSPAPLRYCRADTRFEVRMSETLAKELEEIANEAQYLKAEVFRRAIALYGLT